MNDSKVNVAFKVCKLAKVSLTFVYQFPNKKYERIQIGMIVINCILLFSTISLNGIAVITIRKSSQLKSKVCYFVILLQSLVDVGVGLLGIPFFVYGLIAPFLNMVKCVPMVVASRAAYLPLGLSISTLSAMAMERYIGVLHPFQYKTKLTKKRILAYVSGHGLLLFSVLTFSVRDTRPMRFYVRGSIFVFFIFTAFVYIRIYLVIRKLIRSEKRPAGNDDGNQAKRQIMLESRRARSCFLVIICFFLFVLPFALSPVLTTPGTFDSRVYFNWAFTSIILNSSINSMIFFWTKTLLRKEAAKILYSLCS